MAKKIKVKRAVVVDKDGECMGGDPDYERVRHGAAVVAEQRIQACYETGRDDLLAREVEFLERKGWKLRWLEGEVELAE